MAFSEKIARINLVLLMIKRVRGCRGFERCSGIFENSKRGWFDGNRMWPFLNLFTGIHHFRLATGRFTMETFGSIRY